MEFKTREDVYNFLKSCTYIDGGSQGECYVDRKKEDVYKFYYTFLDPIEYDISFSESEVLRFKNLKSSIFIFPKDVIKLDGKIIGDITSYVKASNLYKINPLTVNLNRLLKLCEIALKEIELISKEHIKCFDMLYNILLGDSFYIIDTTEYKEVDYTSFERLKNINKSIFNLEIIWFLISGLFEEVITQNNVLKEMYTEANNYNSGNVISLLEFIRELKRYLSEILGYEIETLGDARKLTNKKRHYSPYKRLIVL